MTGSDSDFALAETDRSPTVLNVEKRDAAAWSFADLLKTDSSVHVRERGPDGLHGSSDSRPPS
ncbi:MAG: hypothetical protein R2748_12095 [Bryobacterales bacterium]